MYITENKLRKIIRNELILNEISGSSKRALQTSLLVLIPLLMSGITQKDASKQVGDQYYKWMTDAIMAEIEDEGLDPQKDADQIRVIVLRYAREGFTHYLEKKGHLSPDNEEFDPTKQFKR